MRLAAALALAGTLLIGALMAAPTRTDIECLTIPDPNVCHRTRGCRGWPEINWGRHGPPPLTYDAFGVANKRGEYCHQTNERRRGRIVEVTEEHAPRR